MHRVPVRYRVYVRTTNLVERSFVEGRRVSKVLPYLLGEESAMKLVSATWSAARNAAPGSRSATWNATNTHCATSGTWRRFATDRNQNTN